MSDVLSQALHTSHLVQQSVQGERYYLFSPLVSEMLALRSPEARILRILWDYRDGRSAGERLRAAGVAERDVELRRRIERLRCLGYLVHHGADELKAYIARLEANVPALPQIDQVELTNACPLECGFCPRGLGKMTRRVGHLDLTVLRELVAQLPKGHQKKTFGLHHFGDPLLHKRAAEAVRIVRDAGMEPEISFNPVFLTAASAEELLEARPGVVIVSLDGLDTETLQAMRGRRAGTFAEVSAKVEMLLQMARSSGHPPMIIVSMVATTRNRHQWNELLARYSREEYPFLRPVVRLLNDFGDPTVTPLGVERLYLLCSMPYRLVSVLWDGTVVACCQDYDGVAALGNLREQTLREVWEGEEVRAFREQWKATSFSQGHPCERCRWLPKHYVQQTTLPPVDAWRLPIWAEEGALSLPLRRGS